MSTILTMGSFDLMHPGHIELFRACRRIVGDDGTVMVTVNDSKFIESFKGRPPVQSTDERVSMVRSCRYVDEVYILSQHDSKPVISSLKPDFIIIGSDWAETRPDGSTYLDQIQVTPEFLRENNVDLLFHYREGRYSSTELKERVRG